VLISAQGVTATFSGSNLGKVTDIDGDFNTSLKEIRPLANNNDEAGRYLSVYEKTLCDHVVTLSAFAEQFSSNDVGASGALVISGNGWSLTFPSAVLEKLKVTAKVGDYLRVSYTFRRSFQ
jgi:hypothetical protein